MIWIFTLTVLFAGAITVYMACLEFLKKLRLVAPIQYHSGIEKLVSAMQKKVDVVLFFKVNRILASSDSDDLHKTSAKLDELSKSLS